MKTNQILNLKHFGRYVKSKLILTYKQTLMIWGTIVTIIFLLSIFYMGVAREWNNLRWIPAFFIVLFVGGIIYAGMSFPFFRTKEKTIVSLMVPVTALERFLYELLEKIVAFLILLPLFFQIFSSVAVFVRNAAEPGKVTRVEYTFNNTVVNYQSFPFEYISWGNAINSSKDGQLIILLSIAFLLFSIAFAGAATFRKYPLIKTLVFCGALMATIVGYQYLILEKLRLQFPWIEPIGDTWEKESVIKFECSILILVSFVVLAYSYFKIKEKEVQ